MPRPTALGSPSLQVRTKCQWPAGTTQEAATTGQRKSSLPSYGPPTHSTWKPAPGALKHSTASNPSLPPRMNRLPDQPCMGQMEEGQPPHGLAPPLENPGNKQSGGLDSHHRKLATKHAAKQRIAGHLDSATGSNEPVDHALQESILQTSADSEVLQTTKGNQDATTPVPRWWW